MSTLSDLVTVCLDPRTTALSFKVRVRGYKILCAAAMYDLLDRRRIGFQSSGRDAKVLLLDPAPVPEPSLEFALDRYRKHPFESPRNALNQLCSGTKIHDGVFGSLVREGHLTPGTRKYRYHVVDLAARRWLVGGVQASLIRGEPVNERLRRLAAVLAIGDGDCGKLLSRALEGQGAEALQEAKARGKQLARNDLVALALWRSIEVPKQINSIGAALGLADAAIPD